MSSEVAATLGNFPFKRLAEVLKSRRKVCVVGYEFSWRARCAPHFSDIRKGVWSALPVRPRFNPFTSASDYCVVMNWFNGRRQAIRAANKAYTDKPPVKDADFFQTLRAMQGDLCLTIATQAEDGLLSLNGIAGAYELYGNVFQAVCLEHGHKTASWPAQENISRWPGCEICGATMLPDVEMFGWNSQAAVRKNFYTQIEMSDAVILIGADKNLAPFNEADSAIIARLPVIELLEDGIVLQENGGAHKATHGELEKQIGARGGMPETQTEKAATSYQRTMNYLMRLHAGR